VGSRTDEGSGSPPAIAPESFESGPAVPDVRGVPA